jgi:hypothetical protein
MKTMNNLHITLNANMTQGCIVHCPSLDAAASPAPGISRRLLELDGGEVIFSDKHGDYQTGSWLRSPHLSQQQLFRREGCLILVKTGHLARSRSGFLA